MGASTGNMLVDDPDTLDAIFREAPTPIITHCEDTPTIDANLAQFKAKYGDDIPVECHPDIRSREACMKSTHARDRRWRAGTTRACTCCTSRTADELALFEQGPLIRADGSRKRITAETCVHFLRFDRSDYARLGNLIKCNPAIKDASDREALIRALAEDASTCSPPTTRRTRWRKKPAVRAGAVRPAAGAVRAAMRAGTACTKAS